MKNQVRLFMPLFAIVLVMHNISCTVNIPHSPILVLATDNKFGSFTCEMLKTEGFNEFEMDSIKDIKITLKYLKNFDVIILPQTSLTNSEKNILSNYVKDGGNLIAFKPDKNLSDVFGIIDAGGIIAEGYIAVTTNDEIGQGITSESLQLHGEADKYNIKGGKQIAALYMDAITSTGYPAVVVNDYGKGYAMAFLYNLPQSIVYTRQGNYQYAGQEMDGVKGIRPRDMFTNGWVNTSKNILNQADEQMRLLSHGIEKMNHFIKPLPRFWYFPDTLKCLVTLTNDGEDSKEAEFEPKFEDVDYKGAKMTLYVKEVNLISKPWVNGWINKGFEISGHPDDTKQAINPDWRTMDSVYKALIINLNINCGIAAMHTVANHWFVWCGKNEDGTMDFAAQAKIEENNGIGLDCNYSHSDNNSIQGHFLGPLGTNQGNFTGSGLIIKFADVRGSIINVYQHLTNVYDQQYMINKDPEGYYNCFKGLMDRSLHNEVYSFISVKSHNDEYSFAKVPLMRMLEYANSNGIPVWTVQKLLDFIKMKDEATFTDINWSNNRLSFNLNSSLKHSNGLTFMIPYKYGNLKINGITLNGKDTRFINKSVKGSDYAFITVKPGVNYSFIVTY